MGEFVGQLRPGPCPSCPSSRARPLRASPALIAAVLLLLIALGAGACGRSKGNTPNPGATVSVLDREPGLEALSWVTTADDLRIARALAPISNTPAGVPAQAAKLWASNGLRLLSLPVDQADRTRELLTDPGSSAGVLERQWVGQPLDWISLVEGPALQPITVRTDAAPLRLDSGVFALKVRAWVGPGGTLAPELEPVSGDGVGPPRPAADSASPAAVLNIEVLPCHRERARPKNTSDTWSITPDRPHDLHLTRLMLNITARRGTAYLILSEHPETDWNALSRGELPATPDQGARAGPELRTLGELMLLGGHYRARIEGPTLPARTRRVIMLLPRVPEHFSLTTPPAPAPRPG